MIRHSMKFKEDIHMYFINMDELDECVRLSGIYKRTQEEKRAAMRAGQKK